VTSDDLAEVLADFVAVESTPEAGPKGILERAASEVRNLGLTPKVDRKLGTLIASHKRKGVLFNGHLDTVPFGGNWTVDHGTRRGDRLYGRGTADMKAGCVAAIFAAKKLLEDDVPFSFLFTTDEETTMNAAKALAATAIVRDAAAIVVGEPSNLGVFTSEKGVYWFDAIAKGKGAHGSLPHLGDNAILKLRPLLDAVAPYAKPRRPLEDLTINIGKMYGGTKANVVADACCVELDVRYPPSMRPSQVVTLVRKLAGRNLCLIERHHVPAAAVDSKSPHVTTLRRIAGTESGKVTYATEMAFYAQRNPRTVICGPGDPVRIHVPDESVELSEVRRAADIYGRYAAAMAPS